VTYLCFGIKSPESEFISEFRSDVVKIVKSPYVHISYILLADHLIQCCPRFLYIGAHLADGCGGMGAMWRLQ
jgi:hypothetical protein